MKRNKLFATITSILLVCLMLVACAQPAVDAPAPEQPATPEAPAPAPTPGAPEAPQAPVFEAPPAELEDDQAFADEVIIITDGTALSVVDPFSPATSPTASRQALIMVFDTLVVAAGDGVYDPALATDWQNDNYQTITMTLREGVVFNNGEAFTAADVVATAEAGREAVGSMAFDVWRSVETVRAIDSHTVEFVLSDIDVEFFFNLSQPHAAIVSAAAIPQAEANPEIMFNAGTGAFRVESLSPNDQVVFVRNDNYWGNTPPSARQTWLTIPEVPTRSIMLLNGEANMTWGVVPDDIQMFRETDGFDVVRHNNNNPHYLSFNMNDPIAGDLNFRRAIAHAIYKPDAALAAGGEAAAAIDSPNLFGYATEFKNTNIPAIPHDLALARQYLEASVWNGETIVISVAIPTNIRAAEVIQAQLTMVGINAELNVMDVPGFTSTVTYRDNQSQLAVYILPTTLSAASMRNAFFPGNTLNRASFNVPEITAMLEEAATTVDVSARRDLYMRIQEMTSEYMAYIPVFMNHGTIVVSEGFGGLGYSPVGNHDVRFAFQTIEG